MTHAVVRTSPKGPGQKFVGRCIKCGQEELDMNATLQPCSADEVVSNFQALGEILSQSTEARDGE